MTKKKTSIVEPKKKKKKISSSLPISFDPLNSYLQEVKQIPLLSKDEEKSLALQYYKDQNREAAFKLVSGNLWLVVKIARDYQSAAKNLLDLIQEGNIGLMEAVKKFDPYREVRFPSYAVWWIKAYIIRYVIANLRLVKIGTTQAQRKLFFNLYKEKLKLEKEGFYPETKLLADRLNVKESDVIEMEQRLSGGDISLYAPSSSENDTELISVIPAGGTPIDEQVAKNQLKYKLK